MKRIIDWATIKKAAGFTPLREFPYPVKHLDDILYRVGFNAYLMVVNRNPYFKTIPPARKFVSAVVWAESDGAALRAINNRLEDDQPVSVESPGEMLLDDKCRTYEQILEAASIGGSVLESATYRFFKPGTKEICGAYTHKSIKCPSFEFYFRTRTKKNREVPFAIVYSGERARKEILIRQRPNVPKANREKLKPFIEGLE